MAIESRADRRAVIFDGRAERRKTRVEVFRALLRRLRQRGFLAIEDRADRGAVMIEGGAEPVAMSLEQGADALRMLAHLVLELRAARFEPLAHLLQRRDDVVLEPLHADAEGARTSSTRPDSVASMSCASAETVCVSSPARFCNVSPISADLESMP